MALCFFFSMRCTRGSLLRFCDINFEGIVDIQLVLRPQNGKSLGTCKTPAPWAAPNHMVYTIMYISLYKIFFKCFSTHFTVENMFRISFSCCFLLGLYSFTRLFCTIKVSIERLLWLISFIWFLVEEVLPFDNKGKM